MTTIIHGAKEHEHYTKQLSPLTRDFLRLADLSISASAGAKELTIAELDAMLAKATDRWTGRLLATVQKTEIKLNLINAGIVQAA
jgi:hypothetical protein